MIMFERKNIVQTLSLGFGPSADKRVEPGPSRPGGGERMAKRQMSKIRIAAAGRGFRNAQSMFSLLQSEPIML